jgi:hypothetical protein
MSDAPEIKVKLTAEDTGVSAAIKELGSQLKNLKKSEDEAAGGASNLAKAFQGIAAAGALLGFAKIGKDAFDSAVGISHMADKTGLTTQTLSVFHKVAGDVGASTEGIDKALIKATKSITEFQQGTGKSAAAFAMLGIAQKDFQNLSPDQKIKLVTERLGGLTAGFQKSTAQALIFGKGASDITLVANALAAQGFDKASAATSKLGLLLDRNTTDSFIAAKASIQELTDTGKGMATQFEAGLLPAVSDVGEALADSLQKGGVNFQDMGKYAGDVIRGIAALFLGLGQIIGFVAESIVSVMGAAWDEIKNQAVTEITAINQGLHGHFEAALGTLVVGAKRATSIVTEEVDKQKAIYGTLKDALKETVANVNPNAAEEERRKKARIANQRLDAEDQTPEKAIVTAPRDAAAKAELSLEEKMLQDELAIRRAYAKQTETVDKEMYDAGLIDLAEYFSRRKAAVQADADDQIQILQHERALAVDAAAKAGGEATKKPAGSAEQDKALAEQIAQKEKVEEIDAKIKEEQINASTKIHALNTEENKAQRESQQQTLDFEKQLAELQGKRSETAQDEIKAEAAKRQLQIDQSSGSATDKAKLTAELEQWKQAKLAVADYDQARQQLEQHTKAFETAKQTIQNTAASGKISKLEEEKQINQLIKDRLPLLQADAAAETGAAAKTGNQDLEGQAAQAQAGVNKLQLSVKDLSYSLGQSIAGDFTTFFQTVGRGTQTVAQSFAKLAGSVIQSIEQMLIKLLLLQIMNKAAGMFTPGSAGNTFFGGGHAEGGLIKGPGGPKSDSIPARLSAGEFVVKADAVSRFGVNQLQAINRGMQPPSFANLEMPKFSEGGFVGSPGAPGASGMVHLGIGLDKGLILQHLSSKDAGRIILDHITNNPKAASKALGRSQG